jgi:hypothetical protein
MSHPYGDEFGPSEKVAKSTTLSEVLEDAKFKGKVIEYVWDFGLNWSHIITIKGRAEATDTMMCLSGKKKPPGEYLPFFIDPFKRKDKEDVNRRLARLRSKSNGIYDGDGGEDDEEEHEGFDEEDGEEDRDEGYPYSSPESHPGLDRSAAMQLPEQATQGVEAEDANATLKEIDAEQTSNPQWKRSHGTESEPAATDGGRERSSN